MLQFLFKSIKDNKILGCIEKYFYSPFHVIAVVVMMLCCNLFALEYYYVAVNLIEVIYVLLFLKDTLPLLPLFVCGYMATSTNNNPAFNQNGIFYQRDFLIYFIISFSIIGLSLITRLIFRIFYEKKIVKPKLYLGFLLFGATLLLGGLFSPTYSGKTVFFGLVEILALSFTYFYFIFTIDGENFKLEYFAVLFTCIGIAMLVETLKFYYVEGEFSFDKYSISRINFHTGWGITNNVAGIGVMCIPAPFALMQYRKKVLPYFIAEVLVLCGIALTQSRNGILFSVIIADVGFLISAINLPKGKRILLVSLCAVTLVSYFLLCYYNYDKFYNLFGGVIKFGLNSNGRLEIYEKGIKQFLSYPIFGNGFYAGEGIIYGTGKDFLPPRYHNTVVQLLASGGAVTFLAYSFHRYQTVKLFLESKDEKNVYLALTVLSLLLTSLLDCFFFNLGPGIIYGVLLALMEIELNKKSNKDKI